MHSDGITNAISSLIIVDCSSGRVNLQAEEAESLKNMTGSNWGQIDHYSFLMCASMNMKGLVYMIQLMGIKSIANARP
jgi:hypothetical protein